MPHSRAYPAEFWDEAMRLAREPGRSTSAVAGDLGVSYEASAVIFARPTSMPVTGPG